jgi:DNA-binding response OmpR family regulator
MQRLPKILLIDDDKDIIDMVKATIGPLIEMTYANSAANATTILQQSRFDLIVVDLMLGDDCGLALIETIQKDNLAPESYFFILTGNKEVEAEIKGHLLGVREYIKKPINHKLFKILIEKHLREILSKESDISKGSGIIVDSSRHTISTEAQAEIVIKLTPKEFQIFSYLLQNRDRVITRESLIDKLWGDRSDSLFRSVDMHISGIRKKLTPLNINIQTIRSVGYSLISNKNS